MSVLWPWQPTAVACGTAAAGPGHHAIRDTLPPAPSSTGVLKPWPGYITGKPGGPAQECQGQAQHIHAPPPPSSGSLSGGRLHVCSQGAYCLPAPAPPLALRYCALYIRNVRCAAAATHKKGIYVPAAMPSARWGTPSTATAVLVKVRHRRMKYHKISTSAAMPPASISTRLFCLSAITCGAA
jgi:hypothetical protein